MLSGQPTALGRLPCPHRIPTRPSATRSHGGTKPSFGVGIAASGSKRCRTHTSVSRPQTKRYRFDRGVRHQMTTEPARNPLVRVTAQQRSCRRQPERERSPVRHAGRREADDHTVLSLRRHNRSGLRHHRFPAHLGGHCARLARQRAAPPRQRRRHGPRTLRGSPPPCRPCCS